MPRSTCRLRTSLLTALLAAGSAWMLVGCEASGDPNALGGGREGAPGTSDPTAEATPPPDPAFEYAPELSLLPFDVRLQKVAAVLGVETDDVALALLRERRFDLGDDDYASGIKPDYSWTSARVATWVKALKPVCASAKMRERYPALPDGLDALVLAAYGRAVTDEDRAAATELATTYAKDSDTAYRLVCLSVMTSLEFVAR